MGQFIRRFFVYGLIFVMCFSYKAAAQQQAESGKTTRVTLGSSSGTPGTSVVVPLYFTPADGVEVESLKLVIDFVSKHLKYGKMDPGIAAEMGNVGLNAEVKEVQNEQGLENTTLTITASFPTPPEKGIPAGLLGYLTMRINEDAVPASISLRAAAEATELKTNKPITDLLATSATVDVLAPGTQPLVTCFIFSH